LDNSNSGQISRLADRKKKSKNLSEPHVFPTTDLTKKSEKKQKTKKKERPVGEAPTQKVFINEHVLGVGERAESGSL
jgi:hypothetical protein